MRVTCPHCQTTYDINNSLHHKSMRCACCNGIWQPFAGNLDEICTEETQTPKYHSNKRFIKSLATIIIVMALGTGFWASYKYRFELINHFPKLEQIYKDFGINVARQIAGDGLTFENIIWNIDDKDGTPKMLISGTLKNNTDKDIKIPTLKIEFWNDNGYTIQVIEKKLFHNKIKAEKTLDFKTYIDNPMPTTKYIYIGFTSQP